MDKILIFHLGIATIQPGEVSVFAGAAQIGVELVDTVKLFRGLHFL